MTEDGGRLTWLAARRERRRLKRARAGDSPEKLAEHHTPKDDIVDTMLRFGGVARRSRFKKP